MTIKESIKIEEIFRIYLDFCPFYRRTLFKLKDLHDWIKSLKIIRWFDSFTNFFIFMDYLYQNKFIIPLFEYNEPEQFNLRFIGEETYRTMYTKKYFNFSDDDSKIIKGLEYIEIEYEITNDYTEKRFFDIYWYHPIQFIQILTFLKSIITYNINLLKFKDFMEFFYKRLINLPNNDSRRFRERLEKEKKNLSEFLMEREVYKSPSRKDQYIILKIKFNRFNWLKPETLLLFIKLEKIFGIELYSPSSLKPDLNFVHDEKEYPEDVKKENIELWFEEFENKRQAYFSKEELSSLNKLKDFLHRNERNFNGLESWSDILSLINGGSKNKLVNFLSYYINIIEIRRIIKNIIWFLTTEKVEASPDKPKDWFLNMDEAKKYTNQILYKYNLYPDYLFVLYVEGPTEEILFKNWLKSQPYGLFVKVITMDTADDTKAIARCTVRKYKDRKYFFLYDYDNEKDYKRRIDQLKQANINENQFYFFKPDFITENFTSEDMVSTYQKWLNEEGVIVTEETLIDLRKLLNNKEIDEGFENLIRKFNNLQIITPTFSKPRFAKFLSKVLREDKKRNFSFINFFYGKDKLFELLENELKPKPKF